MADAFDQEPGRRRPERRGSSDPPEGIDLDDDATPEAGSPAPGHDMTDSVDMTDGVDIADEAEGTQPAAEQAPASRRNGKPGRISRWDRPPEPHDWRWIVGHIGRALITAGLLMFGFVAYQLWGTGIQTARAQNELDSEFNQFLEENGITPGTLAPATTAVSIPAATGSTASADSTGTASTDPPTTDPPTQVPTTVPPTTAAAVVQDYGEVNPGDALAKLIIPAINLDWNVVAGVSVQDLRKGPGHFPDTPLPGQLGNAAIAGHRTGHGAPFLDLDKLKPGDEIQVETKLGDAYAYIVTDSLVVSPSDYEVITDSDPTVATLTLVTCTPPYKSSHRLVVHATLDPTRGAPVGLPSIFYGQAGAIPVDPVLPADDTTVPEAPGSTAGSTATSSGSDVTAATVAGSAVSASVAAPATPPPAATVDAPAVSEPNEFAGEDAFSQGWFDDGAALPHVAGWAVVLALIGYGAFRVAKRFRRLYLAFLVGFVPFVVVLYFFYENVNRLLPAAI